MADPVVEYNFLGRSGIKVSNICLGTMTFGQDPNAFFKSPTQSDEQKAHEILDKYSELGGNYIDTADVYAKGKCESIIGNWLSKKERERFIVATKVNFQMDRTNPNSVGLSRRHIVESIENSLERLQTHYVDLYQSHIWDPATPLEETLRTFDDLIRCGKVRYYGVSNLCGWQLQMMVDMMKTMGLNKCVSLQQQYNLLSRQSEFEAFMVCRQEGIGVLPWSPLKGGLLTGKFKRDENPGDGNSRIGYISKTKGIVLESGPAWRMYKDREDYWNLIDTLKQLADQHGKSVPQIALRWLLQKDFVVSVVVGATSVTQIEENMGAATGWELSAEEMALLDDISPRDSSYPYSLLWGVTTYQPTLRENKYIRPILERINLRK